MGFMVAAESAPRPGAYFNHRALAHFLERGVHLDHQVSQLHLVGMFSAQRFIHKIHLGEMLPDFLLAF